jgi:hypothetical protein
MSFDLYFARPDPSGRTVEKKNPFTGQLAATPAMLPLPAQDFAQLVARLREFGLDIKAGQDGKSFEYSNDDYDFDLDPEGGSTHLFQITPPVLAVVVVALRTLINQGFQVYGPRVNSTKSEPLDQQIIDALGLQAEYAEHVRALLREPNA